MTPTATIKNEAAERNPNTWRDCRACDEDASEGRSIRHYPGHITVAADAIFEDEFEDEEAER